MNHTNSHGITSNLVLSKKNYIEKNLRANFGAFIWIRKKKKFVSFEFCDFSFSFHQSLTSVCVYVLRVLTQFCLGRAWPHLLRVTETSTAKWKIFLHPSGNPKTLSRIYRRTTGTHKEELSCCCSLFKGGRERGETTLERRWTLYVLGQKEEPTSPFSYSPL